MTDFLYTHHDLHDWPTLWTPPAPAAHSPRRWQTAATATLLGAAVVGAVFAAATVFGTADQSAEFRGGYAAITSAEANSLCWKGNRPPGACDTVVVEYGDLADRITDVADPDAQDAVDAAKASYSAYRGDGCYGGHPARCDGEAAAVFAHLKDADAILDTAH